MLPSQLHIVIAIKIYIAPSHGSARTSVTIAIYADSVPKLQCAIKQKIIALDLINLLAIASYSNLIFYFYSNF